MTRTNHHKTISKYRATQFYNQTQSKKWKPWFSPKSLHQQTENINFHTLILSSKDNDKQRDSNCVINLIPIINLRNRKLPQIEIVVRLPRSLLPRKLQTQNPKNQTTDRIPKTQDPNYEINLLAGEWVGDDARMVPAGGRLGETLQQQRSAH